jgi:hypothetical protein
MLPIVLGLQSTSGPQSIQFQGVLPCHLGEGGWGKQQTQAPQVGLSSSLPSCTNFNDNAS